jgi:hypothetical protein
MRYVKYFAAALALTAACGFASPAKACPLCKEAAESAVESAGELDDDPLAEARAYNHSIYMMLAVPFALFAAGGFYCYRHLNGRGQPIQG